MTSAILRRDSNVELVHRDAIPRPRSFDDQALTVEAVIASSNPVRRRDQRGEFMEVLDPAGLDLATTRGASVLNSHNQSSLDNVLGTIDDARVEGNEVIARIRFSSRPEIAPIIADVETGIIRHLSVGYQVDTWQTGKDASGMRMMTATKWSVREASFVSVPADPTARTRSIDDAGAIRALGRRAGVSTARVDALIECGGTIEDARRAFLNDMLDRSVVISSNRDHNAISMDNPQVFVRAAAEALYVRIAPSHQPSHECRQFIGLSLHEIAREMLRRNGISTMGMTPDALITRGLHSTSDFAQILGDTVGRSLRASYTAAPSGIRQLCRQTTANDFRAKSRLMLDSSGFTLERVSEANEFRYGSMAESKETFRLNTFGRIFSITRQALINDDLGAFSDLSRRIGQAAAAFEAQFLVNLLISNAGSGPTMQDDNTAMFHSNHGNVAASGAAPSEQTLSDARLAMRKQTGKGAEPGKAGGLISATPRFVLVPSELETSTEKQLTQIQAATIDDTNPFARLSLIVEPRLVDPARWYVVASPDEVDSIEYCYLSGAPGPQIETRSGFTVDGVEVKCRLDFGAGAVDWRGWYTNEG
jgi:phage head maturation protease